LKWLFVWLFVLRVSRTRWRRKGSMARPGQWIQGGIPQHCLVKIFL
jgi:hypothetical protein